MAVRIGIIGYGGMGSSHAGYLSAGEVPGATLAAVCDTSPEARERAAKRHGDTVKLFETPEALFDSGAIDAVMIATPHYYHPPLAIAALGKGIHALVEKPAGVYTKQVREMNAVADKAGRVFGIMFNQRTRPLHQKMREIVASGELGELRRTQYVITNWFRTQAYYDSGGWRATWAGEGGGVLVNQCPHNLDLWQWICGMPKRVRAFCGFGKRHDIEVEDEVTAYVEYENGATGVFITSTGEAPGTYQFEIAGDRGKLSIEDNKLIFRRTRTSVDEFLRTCPRGFDTPETWRCEIPVSGGGGEEHKGVTKNFVNAILNGTPLLAPGQEGVRGVELANAMQLSAWTDDWVNLPIDEELFYEKLQEKIKVSAGKKRAEGGKPMDFAGTF
jgi:predicted dehydrogenase